MISFLFGDLETRYLRTRERADVYSNVEADLVLAEDGRELYAEVLFPVVELAAALRKWQQARGAFVFDSMSLDGRWAVRFLPVGEGWRVVNDEDELVRSSVVTADGLDDAIDDFVERLRVASVEVLGDWVGEHFGRETQ